MICDYCYSNSPNLWMLAYLNINHQNVQFFMFPVFKWSVFVKLLYSDTYALSEKINAKLPIQYSGDLKSKLQIVRILNGIWNSEAQPFEIGTNVSHFGKNYLKSGQKCLFLNGPVFKWLGPKLNPQHLKTRPFEIRLEKSGFQRVGFQILTVFHINWNFLFVDDKIKCLRLKWPSLVQK